MYSFSFASDLSLRYMKLFQSETAVQASRAQQRKTERMEGFRRFPTVGVASIYAVRQRCLSSCDQKNSSHFFDFVLRPLWLSPLNNHLISQHQRKDSTLLPKFIMVLRFNIILFSGLFFTSILAAAVSPRDTPSPPLPTPLPFQNKDFTPEQLSEYAGLYTSSVSRSYLRTSTISMDILDQSKRFVSINLWPSTTCSLCYLTLSQGALSSFEASVFSKLDSIASAMPTAASSIKSVESAFQSQLSALSFQDRTSKNPQIFSSGLDRLSSSIANANKTGAADANQSGHGNGGASLEINPNFGLALGLVTLASLFFSTFTLI